MELTEFCDGSERQATVLCGNQWNSQNFVTDPNAKLLFCVGTRRNPSQIWPGPGQAFLCGKPALLHTNRFPILLCFLAAEHKLCRGEPPKLRCRTQKIRHLANHQKAEGEFYANCPPGLKPQIVLEPSWFPTQNIGSAEKTAQHTDLRTSSLTRKTKNWIRKAGAPAQLLHENAALPIKPICVRYGPSTL